MPNLYRLLLPAATLATLLVLVPARAQDAAPPGEPRTPPKADYIATNTKLVRALDQVIPEVQFQDTPFEQVMDFLQELTKLNMTVYWSDLADGGVPKDKPISVRLKNLPLRVVLTEVLANAGGDVPLGYAIRDGVLTIGTQAKLDREPALLAELNLSNAPLPTVVDFLRAADPSFQVVLASDPGVSVDQVMISELRLSKVTASQVLQALQIAYPQIEVMNMGHGGPPPFPMPPGPMGTVSSAAPALWVVRVTAGRGSDSAQTTRVFRLREAIDQLQRDSQVKDRDAARAGVLQLVEAALRAAAAGTPDQEPPQLQVHEPTDTLVFCGTRKELELLSGALDALRPPAGDLHLAIYRLLRRVTALEKKLGIIPELTDSPAEAPPADAPPGGGPASVGKPAAPDVSKETPKTPR